MIFKTYVFKDWVKSKLSTRIDMYKTEQLSNSPLQLPFFLMQCCCDLNNKISPSWYLLYFIICIQQMKINTRKSWVFMSKLKDYCLKLLSWIYLYKSYWQKIFEGIHIYGWSLSAKFLDLAGTQPFPASRTKYLHYHYAFHKIWVKVRYEIIAENQTLKLKHTFKLF